MRQTGEMKHVARILIGVFAGLCLGVGLLLQSIVQFVSDDDAAANTVVSVMSESALRKHISDEIVGRVEVENSDPTQQLVFTIVRQRLVQFVAQKLEEPIASEIVANIVRGAYRVYIDGENLVSIDLSPFAGFAEDAVAAVDARLSTDFGDRFSSFEIERPRDSQQIGTLLTLAKVAVWAFLIIGIALLILLWRVVRPNRINQLRIVAVVFLTTGVLIGASVILLRTIAPQFSTEYSDVAQVLIDFMTSPALQRAFFCVGIAMVAFAVSLVVSKGENAQ